MGNLYIRLTQGLQVFFLKHPNWFTNFFRTLLYDIDVIVYSLRGAQKFLLARENLFGSNFAALGKVILGGYQEVSRGILEPQKRGAYLGRLRLVEDRWSDYFLLFLSDKGAGGGDTFEQVYELVWSLMLEPAEKRTDTPEALAELQALVDKAYQAGNPPPEKDISEDVGRTIIRYMMRVIIQVDLTEEQLDEIHTLVFSVKPSTSMLMSAGKPFAPRKVPKQVTEGMARFEKLIDESPSMAKFDELNKNNLDRKQYVSAVAQMMSIAGFQGGSNLATSILVRLPASCPINLENAEEVKLAVLETARRWAPVNNVNVITQQPATIEINGKAHTFPVGTTLALSIGIASLDPKEFANPKSFDPHRENLCPALLNFNSVGDRGARECPGRGVAVAMASHLLVLWRQKVAAASTSAAA